jgi:hypothetical protein
MRAALGYYETALRHIFMKMIKGAVHVARRREPRLLLLDIAALIFSPLESEPGWRWLWL